MFSGKAEVTTGSGTIALSFDQDLMGSLDAKFQSCKQGGYGLNGNVVGSFSGNLIKNHFESSLFVHNVEVEQPNLPAFTFNGEYAYKAISTDYISVSIDITSRNTLFLADQNYQVYDLVLSKTVNNTTGDYSYRISSEFNDTENPDAYVAYETITPLTGKGFALPSGGQLAISGKDSSVYVYAGENENLRLELDNNNDGVIDEITNTTWQDLVLSSLGANP